MSDRRSIAVLGTASDVGKSVIATALCRYFSARGEQVAPFKAQNMSNNAGVTPDGREIGRAQIVQAEAAFQIPHADMNPVLLKPNSDTGSQLVVLGKAVTHASARDYYRKKDELYAVACQAYDRLSAAHDRIVLEGAGSCAEVNLMDRDIVNFPMAAHADADVILVADIHKGGVFAQIVGTLAILPPQFSARIKGIVINRFRGDFSLFASGTEWIEAKTGIPVLGVLPWFTDIHIDDEDSLSLSPMKRPEQAEKDAFVIGVIPLPHLANFTDVSPLSRVNGVELVYLAAPSDMDLCHTVILPGSKNVLHDLNWIHATGWSKALLTAADAGKPIFGICGGYQMLGKRVSDPDQLEGRHQQVDGIGLLQMETVLEADKITTITDFEWNGGSGQGYEIHMGRSRALGDDHQPVRITARNGKPVSDTDGMRSSCGRVMGTYIHGFWDNPDILDRYLTWAGFHGKTPETFLCGLAYRHQQYDRLADWLTTHIDLSRMGC
ncbi:MAG: cobyric acid synthase CobQ [Deltaproteobacteria bacterium]|nr:MAG: cobyric acid synthase CobQ [Deltaproteobacteria bacterium]